MQLGILHTSLAAKSLDESILRAAQAGLAGVEIMYWQAAEAKALGRPEHAEELLQLSRKHSVAIPSLCLGCLCQKPYLISTAENASEARELIAQSLRTAVAIGAKTVLVPFFGKNAIETEPELNLACENLLDSVDAAGEAGVTLGIETNLNIDQQEYLLNYLGHPTAAKVYYDTGNPMARKLDAPTGIRQLGRDRIAQVHIKDVKVAEGVPADFNVALGGGNVNIRACVEALKAIGYSGWLVLETPPGADALASAKSNLAYLKAML